MIDTAPTVFIQAQSDTATLIAAFASVIAALSVVVGTILTVRGQHRTHQKVAEVQKEVRTANGITLAALADRAEGRRIQTDVATDDRTPHEQGYVDNLEQGGRNL